MLAGTGGLTSPPWGIPTGQFKHRHMWQLFQEYVTSGRRHSPFSL